MMYVQQLPKLKNLQQFTYMIRNFPITGLGIVQYAEHLGVDDQTIDFLKLFSKERSFHSRSDFLNQCALLELMVKEERRQPAEYLKAVEED